MQTVSAVQVVGGRRAQVVLHRVVVCATACAAGRELPRPPGRLCVSVTRLEIAECAFGTPTHGAKSLG